MKKNIAIALVGPADTVSGGISALMQTITAHMPAHIKLARVSTCSAYSGYDHAYHPSLLQPLIFVRSLATVFVLALLRRHTVFHVHLSFRGSVIRKGLVCVLLRLLRGRYIVHAHADATFHEWVPTLVRRALLWGFVGAECFITLTRSWRDYYLRYLKLPSCKLLVLPNPAVLPRPIRIRQARERTNVLFLGRVGDRKGAFDLIQAMALIPEHLRARCYLTLAGDGDLQTACSLVERLHCSSQVSVLGWVSRQKVNLLLAEADVLALPSRMEGMALAVLEGMAWGLAILTSSAGGSDEFLATNRNCLLVKPGDVRGIANALVKLVSDAKLRQRLGTEARKTAERFSIDEYIAKLTSLYENVANHSRTAAVVDNEKLTFDRGWVLGSQSTVCRKK